MPHRASLGFANHVFHVMNRAAFRVRLFESADDYRAFSQVLREAAEHVSMRVLAYSVMPNHWHLVLWPERDHALSQYLQWLTLTHALRWRLARGSVGGGAVYQGRYKAIPVQTDGHLLTACRYVERNPLRAGLVSRAEDWPWTSLSATASGPDAPVLHEWPVPRPPGWLRMVNEAEARDVAALRLAISGSRPFGGRDWEVSAAQTLRWKRGMTGRGRPRAIVQDCRK